MRAVFAILTCITAVTASAVADDPVLADCKSEIARFCPEVPHGTGAVSVCLSGHTAELSPACKTALDRKGPGWGRQGEGGGPAKGRVFTECRKEIAEFCSGVEHGAGRVPTCLDKHRGKLSHACKVVLAIKGGRGKGAGGPNVLEAGPGEAKQ